MARLFAPEGVTSYSHNGHAFDVDDDGTIEVEDHVAASLRHHGFKDVEVAAPPSESVSVKREDLLAALEMLGTAANPTMRADKLASALTAAVKTKAKDNANKPTLTLDKNKGSAA